MRFDRMSKVLTTADLIVISATDTLSCEESSLNQIVHNPLDGSLRDSHTSGNLPQNHVGFAVEDYQHVGVIGQKCPRNSVWIGGERCKPSSRIAQILL